MTGDDWKKPPVGFLGVREPATVRDVRRIASRQLITLSRPVLQPLRTFCGGAIAGTAAA